MTILAYILSADFSCPETASDRAVMHRRVGTAGQRGCGLILVFRGLNPPLLSLTIAAVRERLDRTLLRTSAFGPAKSESRQKWSAVPDEGAVLPASLARDRLLVRA